MTLTEPLFTSSLILFSPLMYEFILFLFDGMKNCYYKYKFLRKKKEITDDLAQLIDMQKIINESDRSAEADKRSDQISNQISDQISDQIEKEMWNPFFREKLRKKKISHRLVMQKTIKSYKQHPAMFKISRNDHLKILNKLAGKGYDFPISGKLNIQKYMLIFKELSRRK